MTRLPSHTIDDAPAASRPLLEGLLQFLNYAGTEIDLPAAPAHATSGT